MKREDIRKAEKEAEKQAKELGDVVSCVLNEKKTVKEAMHLTDEYVENIYAQAYRLYNTGKYEEAMHLFRILIMMNSMEPKYMMGLAASYHMIKDYTNAIQTYVMCSVFDPNNPIPHYHTADCFIQMKDYVSAMVSLELAIDQSGNQARYATIKERSKLSLERLKQQAISSLKEGECPEL